MFRHSLARPIELVGTECRLPVAIILATVLSTSPPASATIINVPADQASIQAAIDASTNGDTVLVAPGRYYENIDYRGKEIVVSSHFLNDRDPHLILNTIIDGSAPADPDTASCVRVVDGQGAGTVLQGFTLTGGEGTAWTDEHGFGVYREGGGIMMQATEATIQYNLIRGNNATDDAGLTSAGGGAIRCGDGNPKILNNVIIDNRGRYGAGIVLNFSAAVIKNNVIARNIGGEDFGGGGIWHNQGGPVIIENNTIVENQSQLTGGGLQMGGTDVHLRNNIIRGNIALTSGSQLILGLSPDPEYCNIQGGYSGVGNIDQAVSFGGLYFVPVTGSETIDAGDPDPAFDDPENPSAGGQARWPSAGLLHNDMGAYGGPGAYPFQWVLMTRDVSVGWVPLDVSFQGYSWPTVSSWYWDFGDGETGASSSPSHTFNQAGIFDVSVTIDGPGGLYSEVENDFVVALADTLSASHELYQSGEPVPISISARNTIPINSFTIPLEYSGTFSLSLDSFSVVGCRTAYFETVDLLDLDVTNHRAAIWLVSSTDGSQPDLDPGVGSILTCWFSVSGQAPSGQVVDILVDGDASYTPQFAGPLAAYVPVAVTGSVTSSGCCSGRVGDANQSGDDEPTIGDVTAMIDAKFISGICDGVLTCLPEADINQSSTGTATCDDITIGDITILIDYLFITGPSLGLPNCL